MILNTFLYLILLQQFVFSISEISSSKSAVNSTKTTETKNNEYMNINFDRNQSSLNNRFRSNYYDNFKLRLKKVHIISKVKLSNSLNISASDLTNKTTIDYETNFVMRILNASNTTLECLDSCLATFIKHILIKTDYNMKNAEVKLSHNSSQLVHFQRNKTTNYVDLSVSIRSKYEFSPLLFLDALKKIAIRPNQTRNIFVYGDVWIDLDPDMQFTYEYDEELFADKSIYKYQPLWVVVLIVFAGVLTVVFIGCIVAICYKRRPYRRASKIYEMEAVLRDKVPKIPTMSLQVKAVELASLRHANHPNMPYK